MDLRAIMKALKFGILVKPQIVNNGDFASNTPYDTAGMASFLALLITGVITAGSPIGSTAETTPPLLEECDTSGGGYTAITGAAMAAVIPDTGDSLIYGVYVDLAKTHKRYIRWQAPHSGDGTPGAALCSIGIGFPSDTSPQSAAEMGLTNLVSA